MGKRTMVAAVGLAFLTGCTTYYKVHDPTTGKDYYTTKLDQKKSGSTTLTDDRTKKMVTVRIRRSRRSRRKSTRPASTRRRRRRRRRPHRTRSSNALAPVREPCIGRGAPARARQAE